MPRRALSLVAVLAALLAAGCASDGRPAQNLVRAALTRQYLEAYHTAPAAAEQALLQRQTTALLQHVQTLPPPPPAAHPPQLDLAAVRDAGGSAAVDEALQAAYILQFHALPGAVAREDLAQLAGVVAPAPLPVTGGSG